MSLFLILVCVIASSRSYTIYSARDYFLCKFRGPCPAAVQRAARTATGRRSLVHPAPAPHVAPRVRASRREAAAPRVWELAVPCLPSAAAPPPCTVTAFRRKRRRWRRCTPLRRAKHKCNLHEREPYIRAANHKTQQQHNNAACMHGLPYSALASLLCSTHSPHSSGAGPIATSSGGGEHEGAAVLGACDKRERERRALRNIGTLRRGQEAR